MAGRTLNLQSIKDKEKTQTAQMPKTKNHKLKHTIMKNTLSTLEAVNELGKYDCFNSFTYEGTKTLVEFIESIEEDCGTEIEFDAVGLASEYAEYESFIDYADDSFMSWQEEFGIDYENPLTGETEAQSTFDCDGNIHETVLRNIEDYIRDNGTLIEFDGGIIVSK